MLAKTACPIVELPVAGPFINPFAEQFQRCKVWRSHIMERLRAERPDLIVISSARGYGAGGAGMFIPGFKLYDDAWLASLKALVEQLRGLGSRVLMLGPSPDPTASTPTCLSAHLTDATACAASRDAITGPGVAAEKAEVLAAGAQYADLTELFCTTQTCPVIVGNTMVYFDAGHITHEYAVQLAPALGALADRALAISG